MSRVLRFCVLIRKDKLLKNYVNPSFKRFYCAKILPATEFITSDVSKPVKLRLEETAPGNYSPILLQTLFRDAVKKYGNKKAIVSCDGKIVWNYNEYHEEVLQAAKGFIAMGLNPRHGVGIMGHNHPYWMVSRLVVTYMVSESKVFFFIGL